MPGTCRPTSGSGTWIGISRRPTPASNWPDCTQRLRLDRALQQNCAEVPSVHYHSLDPEKVTPKKLLEWLQGHWEIEKSLHCLKHPVVGRGLALAEATGVGGDLANLDHLALNVLRVPAKRVFASPKPYLPFSLRAIAEKAHWNLQTTLAALGFSPH